MRARSRSYTTAIARTFRIWRVFGGLVQKLFLHLAFVPSKILQNFDVFVSLNFEHRIYSVLCESGIEIEFENKNSMIAILDVKVNGAHLKFFVDKMNETN